MAQKLLMLALSPTMETGTIVRWTKQVGDTVKSGDIICEVETDKTTMEYETTAEGVLLDIIAPQGSKVKVGNPIAVVGKPGESVPKAETKQAPPPQSKPEVSTATAAAPSVDTSATLENNSSSPQTPNRADTSVHPEMSSATISSPLARTLARQHGIQLNNVTGTGPQGRIIKRDIEAIVSSGKTATASASSPSPLPERDGSSRVPVSEKRRIIAQRLTSSYQNAPHYFIKSVMNVRALTDFRTRYNKTAAEKISFNTLLIKLAAETIKRHPIFNSSWNTDTIVSYTNIDIALAVAQEDGLITPVVRNCQSKGVAVIEKELAALIKKARNNRLSPEEYTNGTFTISNLGSFGIREFSAIINPPQAAILAVGEIVRQPVVDKNDTIVIEPQMTLTLSCDHRLIDGTVSAAFLRTFKEFIEQPFMLLV